VSAVAKRLAMACLLVAGSTSAALAAGGGARLTFDPGVPHDVRALTEQTWRRFERSFPAQATCLPSITVATAWQFPDRARYDPIARRVTVRIPWTAPNLERSLVHEFAHHLDAGCAERGSIRAAFLRAQGFPRDASWLRGSAWADTPSEQFAEATVELVLRDPADPRMLIRPETLATLRAWAGGH